MTTSPARRAQLKAVRDRRERAQKILASKAALATGAAVKKGKKVVMLAPPPVLDTRFKALDDAAADKARLEALRRQHQGRYTARFCCPTCGSTLTVGAIP